MAKTIQQYETTMILNTKKGEDGSTKNYNLLQTPYLVLDMVFCFFQKLDVVVGLYRSYSAKRSYIECVPKKCLPKSLKWSKI